MSKVNPEFFGIRQSVLQVLELDYIQDKTYPLMGFRHLSLIELDELTDISVAESELRATLRIDILQHNRILDKMLKVETSINTLKNYGLRRNRQLENIFKTIRSDAIMVYSNIRKYIA